MDALSSALMLMKLRSGLSGATSTAGNWALSIPAFDAMKLYLVLRGGGWVILSKSKERFHLKPGDCLLVTTGEACIATNDLSIRKPLELEEAFELVIDDVITINGGGETFVISVLFEFEGHLPQLIFKDLPSAIYIPADADGSDILRSNIERFRQEYLKESIGHSLIINHLAPIILIQIIRTHLALNPDGRNWFYSITDPKLAKVMESMHQDCGIDWSVERLAEISGMSRAGFAARFRDRIGMTPIQYLTNWRMQTACSLLNETADSVTTIASLVGYESESAFSAAFKRLIGVRPGEFRRERQV